MTAHPSTRLPQSLDEALDTHRFLCIELGNLQDEVAELESREIVARAEVFARLATSGENITTIREQTAQATAHMRAEIIREKGSVEQLQASLRWLERWIDRKWPAPLFP